MNYPWGQLPRLKGVILLKGGGGSFVFVYYNGKWRDAMEWGEEGVDFCDE